MTEKEAIEKLYNGKKHELISVLRTFKREGIENFVITRKEIIDTILKALEQKDKEIQELKKYDIRNIQIDKDKIISSPSFTRKEVDLMNLGIALSLNADKLFNDESEEEND